jgi:hypothetical protein
MVFGADYRDWTAPQAHADSIAATGVPLLGAAQTLLANPAIAPAPGAPVTLGPFTVGQIGYDIVVTTQFAGGTAAPFIEVSLTWSDPGGVSTVTTDTFICPGATSLAGFIVRGRGPAKAGNVAVTVTNLDAVNTPTVGVRLLEHSRIFGRDDWRWHNSHNAGLTVPGFTLPVLPDDESVLGMATGVNVPANSTSSPLLFGMFSGPVGVGIQMTTGAFAALTVLLQAVPSSSYVANNPICGYLSPPSVFQVAGPRAPMRLILANNTGVALAVTLSLLALA